MPPKKSSSAARVPAGLTVDTQPSAHIAPISAISTASTVHAGAAPTATPATTAATTSEATAVTTAEAAAADHSSSTQQHHVSAEELADVAGQAKLLFIASQRLEAQTRSLGYPGLRRSLAAVKDCYEDLKQSLETIQRDDTTPFVAKCTVSRFTQVVQALIDEFEGEFGEVCFQKRRALHLVGIAGLLHAYLRGSLRVGTSLHQSLWMADIKGNMGIIPSEARTLARGLRGEWTTLAAAVCKGIRSLRRDEAFVLARKVPDAHHYSLTLSEVRSSLRRLALSQGRQTTLVARDTTFLQTCATSFQRELFRWQADARIERLVRLLQHQRAWLAAVTDHIATASLRRMLINTPGSFSQKYATLIINANEAVPNPLLDWELADVDEASVAIKLVDTATIVVNTADEDTQATDTAPAPLPQAASAAIPPPTAAAPSVPAPLPATATQPALLPQPRPRRRRRPQQEAAAQSSHRMSTRSKTSALAVIQNLETARRARTRSQRPNLAPFEDRLPC